jgi:esterase FrsA
MFTFPLNTSELFAERAVQFRGWGIPARTIAAARRAIDDAWREGPGGWTFEWEEHARAAEAQEDWLLAAHCHGAAKFPSVCTESRRIAFEKQVACFERAAPSFSTGFARHLLDVPYRGGTTRVAVHQYWPRAESPGARPLLCLSGGVDMFKIETHRIATIFARLGGLEVVVLDMPGTGESEIALAPDVDEIYRGVLDAFAKPPRKRAIFGISFGGHWSAKLGLQGAVDAAIDCGGPLGEASPSGNALLTLPNGMTGIVGNALRLESPPTDHEVNAFINGFSLRAQGLLPKTNPVPMLVVNGAQDQYVPLANSTVFRGAPGATVWLVRDATHCAAERFPRLMPGMLAWLRLELLGDSASRRLELEVAELILPPLDNAS